MRKTSLWYFLPLLALAALPCAANELGGSITINVGVNDAYLAYMLCGNLNFTGCGSANANLQGDFPAGTYPLSGDIDGVESAYISVFGLDASNGDVIVGLNNAAYALAVNNPWPFLTPEATIESDITGNNTAALATFFADNLSYWLDPSLTNLSGGQLVEFSNGVSVGTFDATIAPEPASLWVTMLMLVGASLVRFVAAKKRQAR